MIIVFAAIYGLPASGKSTAVRYVASQLSTTVSVIELDAFLLQSEQQQREGGAGGEQQQWQGADQFFKARDMFYSAIRAEVKKLAVLDGEAESSDDKKLRIIFAVDNMPLRSMRQRIYNAAISGLREAVTGEHSKSSHASLKFVSIGIKCDLDVCLARNSTREGIARVPDSIIRLMEQRIEYGPIKGGAAEISGQHDPGIVIVSDDHSPSVVAASAATSNNLILGRKLLEIFSSQEAIASFRTVALPSEEEQSARNQLSDEELHRASRTAAHQFDLLRRQANGSFMTALKKAGASADVMKSAAQSLEKRFVEIDRRILQEHIMSSAGASVPDFESAALELGAARDPALAKLLESIVVALK